MEIMSLLDTRGMNRLRADFEKKPEGLSLQEFIGLIILRLPDNGTDDVELVAKLQDLFHQVDVNGDGTMEWDEFSSFCIEAGIAASQLTHMEITEQYVQRPMTDTLARTAEVNNVLYVPQLQKLFVCEVGSRFVRVYDPNDPEQGFRFLHAIDLADAVHDRSEQGNIGSVLAIEYIDLGKRKLFAISSTNMTITFWDAGIYDVAEDGVPRFVHREVVDKPQFFLCWVAHLDSLFTAAASQVILVHHLRLVPSLCVKQLCTLRRHTDLVQDLLAIPELRLVVSAALDKRIILWGADDETVPLDQRIRYKSDRTGHQKGVRSLAYAGDGLLLSAAFDLVVLAWDITGISMRPVFQLRGHSAPLYAVRVLPSKQHALSVDIKGVFRTWDIRREGSIMDAERGIQTFAVQSNVHGDIGGSEDDRSFVPFALAVTYPEGTIITAKKRVVVFDSIPLQKEQFAPVACLYNPTSMTIACALHRDVKIWDARSGTLLCHFQNISETDLTSLCLDFRERKFITADQNGIIAAYNYLNGCTMKDNKATSLGSEIACLVYGREDKVIVAAGWDKSLVVYDETLPEHLGSLRTVLHAHSADIAALTLSHDLSLIATADDNGTLRCWDFQFLSCEGDMRNDSGILKLVFLEPYPLLASTDRLGNVKIWTVRPFATTDRVHRNSCVASFSVLELQGEHDESYVGCMEKGRPPQDPARFWLYFGMSDGRIKVLDITETLESLQIPAIDPAARICLRENYSPYRKMFRTFQEGVEPERISSPVWEAKAPRVVSHFRAHDGTVASLSVLHDPDSLLTCSSDKTIRLWRLDGQQLGQLDANERKALNVGRTVKNWTFPIDMEGRRRREFAEAEKLVNSIMRTITSKRETVPGQAPSPGSRRRAGTGDGWEQEELNRVIKENHGKRRRLSNVLAFEARLSTMQRLQDKEALRQRRQERERRAAHVRELNYAHGHAAEQDKKAEAAAFSLLDCVVTGYDPNEDKQERERTRVLGQLEGKQTWVKTQQELAQEAAVALERKRLKSVKTFAKKAGKKQTKSDMGSGLGPSASDSKPRNAKKKKKKKQKNGKPGQKGQQQKGKQAASAAKGAAAAIPLPTIGHQSPAEEHNKNVLYSNLGKELKRIELKNFKRVKTTLDLEAPALVQQYIEKIKLDQRISKRHDMSAPLLHVPEQVASPKASPRAPQGDEKDRAKEAKTTTDQATRVDEAQASETHQTPAAEGEAAPPPESEEPESESVTEDLFAFTGLSWKFVTDKVKAELEADLSKQKPKLSRSGCTSRRVVPGAAGNRLSALSARISVEGPLASPGSQGDADGSTLGMLGSLGGFGRAAGGGGGDDGDDGDDDGDEETDRLRAQEMARRARESEAHARLEEARRKLAERRCRIVSRAEAARQKRRAAELAEEADFLRSRHRVTVTNAKQTMGPSKAQLKRVRAARYFGPYLRQDVAHIRGMFQSIDTDNTGTIELYEFQNEIKKTSSQSGNFRSLLDQSVSMFQSIDVDKSGTIMLDELARVLFNMATAQELDDILVFLRMNPVRQRTYRLPEPGVEKAKATRNYKSEIRALFDLYDVNKDGHLTVHEMQDAIEQNAMLYAGGRGDLDRGLTFGDFDGLVNELDTDEDKVIDFEEFYRFFSDKWS